MYFSSVQSTFSHVDCEDTVHNPYSNPALDSLKNGIQMGSISPSPDGTFQVFWISVPRILSQHIWWASEETVINRYIYLQVNTILSVIWHIISGTLKVESFEGEIRDSWFFLKNSCFPRYSQYKKIYRSEMVPNGELEHLQDGPKQDKCAEYFNQS